MLVALQTMADQVAVALDNARLFAAGQEALEAERRAYGEISRDAWARLVRSRMAAGYRADEHGVAPTVVNLPPEVRQAVKQGRITLAGDGEEPTMVVPIPVRDQVIGMLRFRKPEGQSWTQDEVALLESMAVQLGLALEGAQLYQDAQRRAVREQLVAQISAEVRASLDPDTILKTSILELGRVLGAERATIEITGPRVSKVGSAEDSKD
jgi:GAF domain-containing protein